MFWYTLNVFYWIVVISTALSSCHQQDPEPNTFRIISNCPKTFTFRELRTYIREASHEAFKNFVEKFGKNEESALYCFKSVNINDNPSEMELIIPDFEIIDDVQTRKFIQFLSYGYFFDCSDISICTNFLFWLVRHLRLIYLTPEASRSICIKIFLKGIRDYGDNYFKILIRENVIKKQLNDHYPTIEDINHAIKTITEIKEFRYLQDPIDLPDITANLNSIENLKLKHRITMLQRGTYMPSIISNNSISSTRYLIRATRYILDRYIPPNRAYEIWKHSYNALTGKRIPNYETFMNKLILKKSPFDSWPHERDVLESIHTILKEDGIIIKELNIHANWYKKLKKEGYMLTVPKNVKTARWFCRFFQHHLHIFITPSMQVSYWKKILENLLEDPKALHSDDPCFEVEDPKFPWPTCHHLPRNHPDYIPTSHDRVVDNLSYHFSRLIHNFVPQYPFSDMCVVTKQLINLNSYILYPIFSEANLKSTRKERKIRRFNYLYSMRRFKSNPIDIPLQEVLFFFPDNIKYQRHITKEDVKNALKKFTDEDIDKMFRLRTFLSDCSKIYSSLPSRDQWKDKQIYEFPPKIRQAIGATCRDLFLARPKCSLNVIPSSHPARDPSDYLAGELALRIFSYIRSIGILNVIPEMFCRSAIMVLSPILGIPVKTPEQVKREELRRLYKDLDISEALNKLSTYRELGNNTNNKKNENKEKLIKRKKLENALKLRWYEKGIFSRNNQLVDLSKLPNGSSRSIKELEEYARLGRKLIAYTSLKNLPTKKFKKWCLEGLKNLFLEIDGIWNFILAQNNDVKKSVPSQNIKIYTKRLCKELTEWQISMSKKSRNFLQRMWLTINRFQSYDFQKKTSKKVISEEYWRKQSLNPEVYKFYEFLHHNLKEKYPHLSIMLPHIDPLPQEIKDMNKLGYNCPPPMMYGRDALPSVLECIRYLYRYGLYILKGIILDFEELFILYKKALLESEYNSKVYIPPTYFLSWNSILYLIHENDFSFYQYQTLCSLRPPSGKHENWYTFFEIVEVIARNFANQLHGSNIVLPGTTDPFLNPPRTGIDSICQLVEKILRRKVYKQEYIIEDYQGKVMSQEYRRKIQGQLQELFMINNALENKQKSQFKVTEDLAISTYTISFVQSCINVLMNEFGGLHYVTAAILCRKSPIWKSCDDINTVDNYVTNIQLNKPIEDEVLQRLFKGIYIDIIAFELLEIVVSYFWIERGLKLGNELPLSYLDFCGTALKIHKKLKDKQFKDFNSACMHTLQGEVLFRKEINGKLHIINDKVATDICSRSYWGQSCGHPVLQKAAQTIQHYSLQLLGTDSPIISLLPFCIMTYQMAFSKEPFSLCTKSLKMEGIVHNIGKRIRIDKKEADEAQKSVQKFWDISAIIPEVSYTPMNDPYGFLGHIIRTHTLNNVYLEDLKSICIKSGLVTYNCMENSKFAEENPHLLNDEAETKKLNNEAFKMFSTQIMDILPRTINELPIRIGTFNDICKIANSTYNVNSISFNVACVNSLGWQYIWNSQRYQWQRVPWEMAILYCSTTPRWLSCESWANRHQRVFQNLPEFEFARKYLNGTPLQRAGIDFLTMFFVNTITMYLEIAYPTKLKEDSPEYKYTEKFNADPSLLCPASIELLMSYENFEIYKLPWELRSLLLENQSTYQIVREKKSIDGIPYLFFNYDCPEILQKRIGHLFESTEEQIKNMLQRIEKYNTVPSSKTMFLGVPKAWKSEFTRYEFGVRVCRRHYAWKQCKIQQIRGNELLNPQTLNLIEITASAMYFKVITEEIILQGNVRDTQGFIRPSDIEFKSFCNLAAILFGEKAMLLTKDRTLEIISEHIPSYLKFYLTEIYIAFLRTYQQFSRGIADSDTLNESKTKFNSEFSFT
ncbi:uncharacterized protein CMU_014690 [Cryptosporidium muris RN66]|uniref:Uncharacterized protein n=1 Tax=Cryptosporidium muris (strain RN66) TaxID=441375 RepID=B6AF26_CRYMR|nr:uncharacterized protein CMU_014690 [Cryptosporidium muris RN66]EEA06793.1 hypothetical protein, conserved [Cryptosporidium muris RN66]|eukprot:XP_002141142.1 hypothetical protein [Cryptosporidium muris RN66]